MKIKTSFLLLFLTILVINTSNAQLKKDIYLGFRVGEPLGLNLRKTFKDGERAFDVNIGTYGFLYNKNRRYGNGAYKTAGLMIQGIYLFQKEVFNLDWAHVYYGFGGQINNRSNYLDKLKGQSVDHVKQLSIGGTGTAGVELKIPNQPMFFFIDTGLYIELMKQPFFVNPQISTGLRLKLE